MTATDAPRSGGRSSLRSFAYDSLLDQILSGDLPPGTAISEADVAARLGVSRSPVREAIQMLAREGLVEVYPKRGTLVARPSLRDARESFELRAAVEGMAARLAAERRTPDELDAMKRIVTGPDARRRATRLERAVAFHTLVVDAARNRYLKEAFETEAARIELISIQAAGLEVPQATPGDRHGAILDAIERRDANGAEDAMRDHLAQHLERLLGSMLS